MKLKRFLLRYFPPGLILVYESNTGAVKEKTIDLLDLNCHSDLDATTDLILKQEVAITEKRRHIVRELVQRTFVQLGIAILFFLQNLHS
jgi:dynein assembly factor with WDR repeat domains 1